MSAQTTVRPAAVAGSFYPQDPRQLETVVDKFMADARAELAASTNAPPAPKAIIVPHAGLRYSGAIAARAWARVTPIADRIRRVVLFGPAHRLAVRGLAIPSVDAFETPLGRIALDRENLDILKTQPYTEVSDAAHRDEHCLEIELPFMHKVLRDIRLTPVLVGGAKGDMVSEALKLVWGGAETLIVISSDLSHYHPYHEAQSLDTATSMSIVSLQAGRLRSEDACGCRPVDGLLRRARELDLVPTTLDVRNSGDTAGSPERVVGYGAWAFTDDVDPTWMPLADADRQELLRVAVAGVRRAAAGQSQPNVSVGTFRPRLQMPGACFVTLTQNGRLRGCLGSLKAYRPLVMDVVERGFATAAKDPRFSPVTAGELPGMDLEVSVLTAARSMSFDDEADLLGQLRPGTDGLIIEDQGHRATFLPKVWDEIPEPQRFLGHLKNKAGLRPDHWSDSFKAWRYETERCSTTL
jgi:hypothetical protein